MTQDQLWSLLSWHVGPGLFFLAIATIIVVDLVQETPWFVALVALPACAGGLYYILPAVVDVCERNPLHGVGSIAKSTYQGRGPVRYDVEIGGIRLQTRRSQWAQLSEGVAYEVYYAGRTKWLLSWQQVDGVQLALPDDVMRELEQRAAEKKQPLTAFVTEIVVDAVAVQRTSQTGEPK